MNVTLCMDLGGTTVDHLNLSIVMRNEPYVYELLGQKKFSAKFKLVRSFLYMRVCIPDSRPMHTYICNTGFQLAFHKFRSVQLYMI